MGALEISTVCPTHFHQQPASPLQHDLAQAPLVGKADASWLTTIMSMAPIDSDGTEAPDARCSRPTSSSTKNSAYLII
jgi:hypothetical protein